MGRRYRGFSPLSQHNAHSPGLWQGDAAPDAPEFPDLDDGVWLIGKFENYRAILSSSQRSVYTEVDLRIQHVFGHPNVSELKEGKLIQVERLGGTIQAPWGETLSYEVHPNRYDFQPDHVYLLRVGYHAQGNFYTAGIFKTIYVWDLTDGSVKPNSHEQAHRVANSRSEIVGLKVPEMIQLLDRKFEEHYRKGH